MQNTLDSYEEALKAIEQAGGKDRALDHKHKAVLSLIRAGSLDFALAEYSRYGLDGIRNHEDIMGLGGRLYKDLFLSHHGAAAREFARQSAEKYEAAFKDTGGFYSGINAATMSLLGGIPQDIVTMRAKRILNMLDSIVGENDNQIYFIEATRAEAYLLQGDISSAQSAFRRARDYDPLNFIAHASTLKQFRMIEKAKGESWPWLTEFVPPRAVHFAGHIFGRDGKSSEISVLSKAAEDAMADQISNIIQVNDIGFAYGALAAGSDIIIAESILAEGGELHVILPISQKTFLEASVRPFGDHWVDRFHECLDAATSVTVLDNLEGWPDSMLQHRASVIAMGGAIRKSEELSVAPGQLLIWDQKAGEHGTANDAAIWRESGREQFVLPYPAPRNAKPHVGSESGYIYQAKLKQAGDSSSTVYADIQAAVSQALESRRTNSQLSQTLSYNLALPDSEDCLGAEGQTHALPGSIIVCDLAANYLTVYHSQDYRVDFVGLNAIGRRIFALRERG